MIKAIKKGEIVMSLSEPLGGEVFNLKEFTSKWRKFSIDKISYFGCPIGVQCGTDVFHDFVFIRKLRKKDACIIEEEQIRINIPGAINQLSVFRKLLSFEALGKRSRCQECRHRNVTDSFADDYVSEDDDRRTSSELLSDPSTPEDICREKELINMALSFIDDSEQRMAFWLYVMYGYTHQEIATGLKKEPDTVRQWFKRNRKKIDDGLDNIIFRRKK